MVPCSCIKCHMYILFIYWQFYCTPYLMWSCQGVYFVICLKLWTIQQHTFHEPPFILTLKTPWSLCKVFNLHRVNLYRGFVSCRLMMFSLLSCSSMDWRWLTASDSTWWRWWRGMMFTFVIFCSMHNGNTWTHLLTTQLNAQKVLGNLTVLMSEVIVVVGVLVVLDTVIWHVPVMFESSVLKIRNSLSLLSTDDW